MSDYILTEEIRAQRVAIMEDVIKQLDDEERPLQIKSGAYIQGLDIRFEQIPHKSDLRDHADLIQDVCKVCLKGAMILSKARLFDRVPMSKIFNHYYEKAEINVLLEDANEVLSDVFDPITMDAMEVAFEKDPAVIPSAGRINNLYLFELSASFGMRYDHVRARARAVAQNVIDNHGEFDPVK